jgi:hypothetical protein
MQAFDQLNDRYGRGTIKLGCALTGKKPIDDENVLSWELRREYLYPRCTTKIAEIPTAF